MTKDKSEVILNFLSNQENRAFFVAEIIEALKKENVTFKDLMKFIEKQKGKNLVYMESAEPFGEGILLTWISRGKPLERALKEAMFRVRERKESLEAKVLETADKIMSFLGKERFILDVGCGTGRLSIPLAEAGNAVVGLDLSKRSLLTARNWAKRKNVKLDLVVGAMENLPFKAHFDGLICFYSLEFASDPFKALKEFKRVIKERGSLIVSLLPALDEHVRGQDFKRFLGGKTLTNTILPWEVVSLLKETGFIVKKQEPIQFIIDLPNDETKDWILNNPKVAMCMALWNVYCEKR
jgi:2-polyprenyl-3-methyl-5-hydroxy-6-metoxy-1,4-benzoquinol methylase